MSSNIHNLKDLITGSDFQKMQDELSVATNVAMITVDYAGSPVTTHSSCSEFCKRIRENSKYRHLCEKCDSRGGLEAARMHKPYIYLCHMGIVDFAIPIIANDIYIGAVMAGQLLLNEADIDELECIVWNRSDKLFLDSDMRMLYDKLPRMSLEKINALANMISYMCNSLIKEMLSSRQTKDIELDNNININSLNKSKARHIVAPAISYIDKNYMNNFSLRYVSDLCQVSPSYLSRLFKKVLGCNFAHYVKIVRVSHAKKLLSKTNNSVASISLELGYEDCGYFIKVFKRIEGITPNEYRNKYSDNNDSIDEANIKAIFQT